MLEDSRIASVRQLEPAILSWYREAEHSNATEFRNYIIADRFFFIDLFGIDNAGSLHPVEFARESPDDFCLCGICTLERLRVRKEKIVMHRAGKNAARKRRSGFRWGFWSFRSGCHLTLSAKRGSAVRLRAACRERRSQSRAHH